MNYKILAAIAWAALALTVGACSSDDSPSRTKVQFVNAAPAYGTIEFESNGVRHSVAPREASPVFEVEHGSLIVSFRASTGAVGTRELGIDENSNFLVARPSVFGGLDVVTVDGFFTPPGGDPLVAYYHYSSEATAADVYFVPVGTDIAAVQPSHAGVSGVGGTVSVRFTPGTYEMVIAPAGKKTVLFKSAPMELRRDQQLMLVGASRSSQIVTPQPIVLELDAVRSLADSRPVVRLLSDLLAGSCCPYTLKVDGDVVARLINRRPAGESFHITPGRRMFLQEGGLPMGDGSPQEIAAGQAYTLSFRQRDFSTYPVAVESWSFRPAIDYPVPAGKARVRLLVENVQRENLVKVDGQVVTYANQSLDNAGLLLDRDPGPITVEVFTPDTVISEGVTTLSLEANHYYVVRFLSWTGHPGPLPYPPGGPAVPRAREVSSD